FLVSPNVDRGDEVEEVKEPFDALSLYRSEDIDRKAFAKQKERLHFSEERRFPQDHPYARSYLWSLSR
ncbi:MAG TPA: hypothetical protein PLO75_01820, partial [Thermotogota bacterium]|nr:hypothetical protein [Thermotogota bacterium]